MTISTTRTPIRLGSLSRLLLVWLGLASLSKHSGVTRTDAAGLMSSDNSNNLEQEEEEPSSRVLHTHAWLQEDFPNPETQPGQCHAAIPNSSSFSFSGRVCDPDQVLKPDELQHVNDYLQTKHYANHLVCPTRITQSTNHEHESDTNTLNTKESETKLEIQMAVVLVEKMNLAPFAEGSHREEQAAETFARYLHDKWGVGVDTEDCGGAGILLFLSIQDRTIYISRGAALEAYLTDIRLDKVIDNMKDLLRAERYPDAILSGLDHMLEYIHQGPPTTFETFVYYLVTIIVPFLWLGGIFVFLCWNMYKVRQKRQDYARVKSQLSEIDRAHAEALQGKYCATSCPICLEDFEAPQDENGLSKNGSDGQPLKLLRCGHVMDESCWAEWINSGRGTVTKCPICQQDVGTAPQHQDRDQALAANGRQENALLQHDDLREENEERAIRIYRRERNFRLARLAYRFPQFVRPQQIQRWTQSTYDGSLVRDPSFVQSNPASAGTSGNNRSGGSRGGGFGGGGFGGASSAGGRGGRW